MTEIVKREEMSLAIEKVLMEGDLKGLSPDQRVTYYNRVCETIGLNPLTRPFDYLNLNGKLTLYARKDATEQLRKIRGVSIVALTSEVKEGIYIVQATAQDKDGRIDQSTGAVSIENIKGEMKANAIMKAETKAKRRVTLSICGLGWMDESEIESVPQAQYVQVDQSTGEIMTRNQPPRLVKNNAPAPIVKVVSTQPQSPAADRLSNYPSEEADVDFGQGEGWDDIPDAAEMERRLLEVAPTLLHIDMEIPENAVKLMGSIREKHKQSGDKFLSVVNKNGQGSGQYGLLVGKIDHICGSKKAHGPVLAALCGVEVSQENPPGWKVKELIDWLQEDSQYRTLTADAVKAVWEAINKAVEAVNA